MKVKFLSLILSSICAVVAFAETKINVTQSIRYGNGQFAVMDSPQISLKKAFNEGGKVFLRYDFEITNKGFLESDDTIVFLRFPDKYATLTMESYLKVTALSGASDLACDLKNSFVGTQYYSSLSEQIGRLPKARRWRLHERKTNSKTKKYEYDLKETIVAIPIKMTNKKGNKAYIEFYIDFKSIYDAFRYFGENDTEFASWLSKLFDEFPIDITFLVTYNPGYSFWDDKYPDSKEYIDWGVDIESFDYCQRICASSNRSFTLLVSD